MINLNELDIYREGDYRCSQEMVRAMIRDNGENRNRTYRLKENE